jgi:hypothetical protein
MSQNYQFESKKNYYLTFLLLHNGSDFIDDVDCQYMYGPCAGCCSSGGWLEPGKTKQNSCRSINSRTTMPGGHALCWRTRMKSSFVSPILKKTKFGVPLARP